MCHRYGVQFIAFDDQEQRKSATSLWYAVDMYANIEQQRLNYIKMNQLRIRVDLYCGLSDAVAAGDTDSRELGCKIVLPSSYTGIPRQMFELYEDAMSIVRKYGKPDLSITFTCNPKWDEITI